MAINKAYVVFAIFFVALAIIIPLAVVLSNQTNANFWTLLTVLPTQSLTLLPDQVDYSDGASIGMNANGSRIVVATTQSATRVYDPIPGSTGKYRQMGDDLPSPSVVSPEQLTDVNPLVLYPNVVAMSADGTILAIAHPAASRPVTTATSNNNNRSDTMAAAVQYSQFYGYVQVYSLQYVAPAEKHEPMVPQINPVGAAIRPTLAANLWNDHVDFLSEADYDALMNEYLLAEYLAALEGNMNNDNNGTDIATDDETFDNNMTSIIHNITGIPAAAMDGVPQAMQFGQAIAMDFHGTRMAVGVQVQVVDPTTQEVSQAGFVQVWQRDATMSNNATTQWKPLGIPMKGACAAAADDVNEEEEMHEDRCVPCQSGSDFGTVLAMNHDGTRIATAAPQWACDSVPNYQRGFVRVYELVENTSMNLQTYRQMGPDIVLPEAFPGQTDCSQESNSTCIPRAFGSSISMSLDGSTVAVGSNYGAVVLVWDESNSIWVQRGRTLALYDNNLYTRVSLGSNGTRVAISSPYHHYDVEVSGTKNPVGLAAVFQWESVSKATAGTWNQVANTIEQQAASEARQGFGSGLALAADTGAIMVAAGTAGEGSFVYGEPQQ